MAAENITLDELVAELNRLGVESVEGAEGLTVQEWAEQWGIARSTAQERIRSAVKNALAFTGRARRQAMDGSMRPVPVYRFQLPQKTVKKAKK